MHERPPPSAPIPPLRRFSMTIIFGMKVHSNGDSTLRNETSSSINSARSDWNPRVSFCDHRVRLGEATKSRYPLKGHSWRAHVVSGFHPSPHWFGLRSFRDRKLFWLLCDRPPVLLRGQFCRREILDARSRGHESPTSPHYSPNPMCLKVQRDCGKYSSERQPVVTRFASLAPPPPPRRGGAERCHSRLFPGVTVLLLPLHLYPSSMSGFLSIQLG